jgi:hypothetical protein
MLFWFGLPELKQPTIESDLHLALRRSVHFPAFERCGRLTR